MGQLTIPPSGLVYIDTSGTRRSPHGAQRCKSGTTPLWRAAQAGSVTVVTSELAVLECLVGPLKAGDKNVLADYDSAMNARDLRLIPIDNAILRSAARIRADFNLRTPDAIHAATALSVGSVTLATNDLHFNRVPGLNVQVLSRL